MCSHAVLKEPIYEKHRPQSICCCLNCCPLTVPRTTDAMHACETRTRRGVCVGCVCVCVCVCVRVCVCHSCRGGPPRIMFLLISSVLLFLQLLCCYSQQTNLCFRRPAEHPCGAITVIIIIELLLLVVLLVVGVLSLLVFAFLLLAL